MVGSGVYRLRGHGVTGLKRTRLRLAGQKFRGSDSGAQIDGAFRARGISRGCSADWFAGVACRGFKACNLCDPPNVPEKGSERAYSRAAKLS